MKSNIHVEHFLKLFYVNRVKMKPKIIYIFNINKKSENMNIKYSTGKRV